MTAASIADQSKVGSATVMAGPTLLSVQPSAVVPGSTVTVSATGVDAQNLSNDTVAFTQSGRVFSASPSAATIQGSSTNLTVPLPPGMSPTSTSSSLAIPTSVSLSTNGVSAQNSLEIQVQPPAHALSVLPNSAALGTSLPVSLSAVFTAFNSASTVSSDDPNLTFANISIISPTLLTATLNVGAGTSLGNHTITASSGGSTIPFSFGVVAAPSAPVVASLSATQLSPGAPLTISGSGFLPSNSSPQAVIRYRYAGLVAESLKNPASDSQVITNIPLLIDPNTGSPFVGSANVQVVIEGVPSNSVPISILALPANTGVVGATTEAYINNLVQQLTAMPTHLTSTLSSSESATFNSFLAAAIKQLQQLQGQVAMAAAGGQVVAPDGTVITQSAIDIIDRLLQASGTSLNNPMQAVPKTLDIKHLSSYSYSSSLDTESTTVTLTESTLVGAGTLCKDGDIASAMSDQLTQETIGVCSLSLIPILSPVAGPVCGFLKLFAPAQLGVELGTLACNVAPVNLAVVTPNPATPVMVVQGPSVTEAPSGVFKSSGSAIGQVAETTSDLLLSRLLPNVGIFKYISGNKIVSSVLNDAFQYAFTNLIGNVIDTSVPTVYYFETNPVPLSMVSLQPSPNGFFTFSGLAMEPGGNAGSTNLYFDTSNFRALDPVGNVTNVSSIVTGNQIPAVIHTVVTVSPSSTTVVPGGQAQFQAVVSGVGLVWGVTWSVDNVSGGDTTVGTISSSGLYAAPLTTGTHTITATSLFDFSSGSATVTLTGTTSSIRISPLTAIVPEGSVQTFAANVQGGGTAIWSIQEGDVGGTISNSGIYTAPKQAGIYHVVATNSANSSEIANATVTVVAGPSIGTIHSFNHATEGAIPWSAPIFGSDGNLYGVTQSGGSLSCAYLASYSGCGTVYESDKSGNVVTLYSFSGTDGAYPVASLAQGSNGSLYGVTSFGGANTTQCVVNGTSNFSGCGALFSVTLPSTFSLLYSFGPFNSSLAVSPQAPLIQASSGIWYGSTIVGGNSSCSGRIGISSNTGCGALFTYSSSGGTRALYTFSGSNGAYPDGALLQQKDGNFYGTTSGGGLLTCSSYDSLGCGTVFQITAAGAIKTLHSFNTTDGAYPLPALILGSDGSMYSVTVFGGSTTCSGGAQWQGCGTIFKIDTAGNFTPLHSFSGPDGAYPTALIQASDGYFYGSTQGGGDTACAGRYGPGCGTIFRMDSAGNVTVLYSFTGQSDGSWPESGVVQGPDGNLYGTTAYGGTNDDGVIFRISNLTAAPAAASAQFDAPEVIREPIVPLLVKQPHVGPPGPPAPAQP